MKKLYLFLVVVFLGVSLFAQQPLVESEQMLAQTEQGGYYHPQFSPDGTYIVSTSESYNGLQKHDVVTGNRMRLTDARSAGYGFSFTPDSRSIYYRESEPYTLVRMTMLERVNTTNAKKVQIGIPVRWNKDPKSLTDIQYVTISDEGMVLHREGEETILAPMGAESYYWASVSPDGQHILFSTAYHGTVVCDINGENTMRLGRLNAPRWLGNDFVVGMQETDDMQGRIVSSRLVIKSADGRFETELKVSDKAPMYPAGSADGKSIVYNNPRGQLFVVTLSTDLNVLKAQSNLRSEEDVMWTGSAAVSAPKKPTPKTNALEGIKIYLNPGHGGFDSNDRSCWTIPVPAVWTDSAGYWESKSNFVKGLALRRMLQEAGATVYFSRERNDSGIRDIDEFRRKNPNATQHEIDSVMVGGDRDLSAIAEEANAKGVDHFLSIHSNALNTKTNYLLMLYHGENGKPTVAQSDQMAAMAGSVQITNPLTTWTSAAPLIRGDITFYGDSPNDPLAGLGVLRPLTVPGHLSEGSFHDYPPETHRLMNKDYCTLEALRMYQYFHKWFKKDLPGTATISGYVKSANEKVDILGQPKFFYLPNSDDQWLPLNGAKVTLLDATGETELQSLVTDDWYNGIYAFYDLEPGSYKVKAEKDGYKTKIVDVTVGANEISGTKIQLVNAHIDVADYLPSEAGTVALPTYDMEAVQEAVAVQGSFDRVLYRKGQFYALSLGQIASLSADNIGDMTKAKLLPMPTGIVPVDIIFTADDYLCALTVDGAIYAFDENDENPTKIYESAELGRAFAVTGPLWKAKFYVVNEARNAIIGVEYSDLKQMSEFTVKTFPVTDITLTGVTPMIMPNGDLYLDSKTDKAVALTFDWATATAQKKALAAEGFDENTTVVGATFFRYADKQYMAFPTAKDDGKNVGFVLMDVTDGLDHAVLASKEYPEGGLGATPATYMTAMSQVDGYNINVYLLAVGQGFQHFRTLTKPVAAIYAGEVNITDDEISFRLNEDATAVVISIESEGEITDTYDCGALKKGLNKVINPFKDKEYDAINISASARPIAFPQKFSTDDVQMRFYSARGVCVDKTPSSPYFGRIYVSETVGGATTEGTGEQRTTTKGIYVLSSDFTDITNQGNTAWAGNVTWGGNSDSELGIGRAAVAENGEVFITSSSLTSSGIYIMNPAKPDSDFVAVFEGKRNANSGKITKGLNSIVSPPMHCYIKGKDENRILYVMERDRSLGSVYSNILQFNIGEEGLPWKKAPTAVIFDDMATGSHFQNGNGQLYPDGRGGWWMSQYRYDSSVDVPGLMHINSEGKPDFNIGTTIAGCRRGGLAVTVDGNRLAIMITAGLSKVYDIEYDNAGVPTLTAKYDIQWGNGSHECWAMDFDAAGNLYIVSNLNERLMAYSLPTPTNTYNTRIVLKEEKQENPDGLEALTNTKQQKGVYSVDGKYLGESVEALPEGIYIVNGKKIVK